MQSLKSNALEPTRSELAALSRGRAIVRMLPIYGLPILTVLLIGFFSYLLPDSFPTAINARSILSDKSIIALLALAAMVPMMAGRIDLTIGFGIVMWHILAISLQVQYNFPWPLACLIVVLCAGTAGLINGLLVEVAQIDSFIATLGTGTILYALALWHTGGRQVIGELPPGFVEINGLTILGVPIPAVYVLVLAVALWITTERMPLGRHIYAIGANEKAAALNGIPVRAYVIGVFVASGLIVGFTGCVLASKLQIGQANVGLDYLLPALVGTFLGSTTIRLGRVNVWGTIVGVLILAVGISGIQQLGGAFFVEPLFNGITLLIAIALAGFAQRRRSVTTRKPSITGLEPTRHSDMRSGEPSAFAEASADTSGPPAGTNSEREDGDGEVSPVT
jgi:ribose transport system permease protein